VGIWRVLNRQKNVCCGKRFACVVMPEIQKGQSFAGNAGIQVYGLEGKNVKLQVNLVVRSY